MRGTHDFHTEGCVVASQNSDQQKPKSTRRKPRSTKIITHKHKDMPKITKPKFWNPNPKLNPIFFNNYIETKFKDIQQLHKDKTQNSKLKFQINEQNLRSETTNNLRFRERES